MKVCAVCKTPIQEGLELDVEEGFVHPGVCMSMYQSTKQNLNESTDATTVEEIQMII